MIKHKSRTPLFINSWYFGAGNLISSFTWRAKRPYKKIKQLYGEKLNDFHSEEITKPIKVLSQKEKERIRNEIKADIRQQNIKLIFASLISILFAIAFLWTIGYVVRKYYF